MLGVTAIWGWTFVVVKDAVMVIGPLPFLAFRFALAAAVMAIFAVRRPSSARVGLALGGLLTFGYLTQTLGLQRVSSSTAGLLTGLFVVLTPVADAAIFRVRPRQITVVAVAVALAGMLMLTIEGGSGSDHLAGVVLLLACATAFAIHIGLLSRYSVEHDSASLAAWQLLACAGIFLLLAGSTGTLRTSPRPVLPALLITAVGASAIGFLVQARVQQRLAASRTALLLTAEPAFATLFGVVLAHDRLSPLRLAGAVTILVALVAHEALIGYARRERPPSYW